MTLEDRKEYYMREALKEANKAQEAGEVPIGAVIVSGDRIIARAHNLTERLNDPTAHAEMQAITIAADHLGGKYLHDCSIYVTIEPCPMCAGALAWAQIKELYYGAKDEKRGYSLYTGSLLHPKTKVENGILEQECGEIVSNFFKKLRG